MAEENEVNKGEIKDDLVMHSGFHPESVIEEQEFVHETKITTPDFKTSAELDLDKIDQVEKLKDVEVIEPQKIGHSKFGEEKYNVPVASAVELNDEQKAENLLEILNGKVPIQDGHMNDEWEKIEDFSQS